MCLDVGREWDNITEVADVVSGMEDFAVGVYLERGVMLEGLCGLR